MALTILKLISGCLLRGAIDPFIRVSKNASFKGGGCMPRKFAVVEQLGNSDWRRERGYGYRWMAESAFSSIEADIWRVHLRSQGA